MGKTNCLGCGKSLGGILDGFGTRVIYGNICLSCKKIVQSTPNYQALTPEQMKIAASGAPVNTDPAVKPPVQENFIVQAQPVPPDEELRQYKRMLDDGLITEEEYAALKKRVLDL